MQAKTKERFLKLRRFETRLFESGQFTMSKYIGCILFIATTNTQGENDSLISNIIF